MKGFGIISGQQLHQYSFGPRFRVPGPAAFEGSRTAGSIGRRIILGTPSMLAMGSRFPACTHSFGSDDRFDSLELKQTTFWARQKTVFCTCEAM